MSEFSPGLRQKRSSAFNHERMWAGAGWHVKYTDYSHHIILTSRFLNTHKHFFFLDFFTSFLLLLLLLLLFSPQGKKLNLRSILNKILSTKKKKNLSTQYSTNCTTLLWSTSVNRLFWVIEALYLLSNSFPFPVPQLLATTDIFQVQWS